MQLFYAPEIHPHLTQFTFSQEESKHIVKVLRKQTKDKLFITNGNGYLFESCIVDANVKRCTVTITKATQQEKRPYKLHLAVAPTKMNDRFEWFLEKATEIGVDAITPIICENSERRVIKPERLEKVVQTAMKQSLQTYLPVVQQAITMSEFLENCPNGMLLIAHCAEDEKTPIHERLIPKTDTTVLIGPEGDFSTSEIKIAIEKGFLPVSLGKNRLRTETAAVYTCAALALANS